MPGGWRPDPMAILLHRGQPVLVHNAVSAYARGMIGGMRAAGTNLVGGIAPGRAGEVYEGLPLFDTVGEAVAATAATACVLYNPAPGVHDAVVETVDAGVQLLVVAAEYVPTLDTMRAVAHARRHGAWVIGPNCLGLLSPGLGMLNGIAPSFGCPGRVGVISRSGTLTLAVLERLTEAGLGQSTVVSIGGDSIIGRNPAEYVQAFEDDPETDVIVLLGEIGGRKEYQVAEMLPSLRTPVVALIVGRNVPEGRRLGHAGALISNEAETAAAKRDALRRAGALIADDPAGVVALTGRCLGEAAALSPTGAVA